MCLTEPGAGSDVGALKTTAKRLPEQKYLITGTKIFISSGENDLVPNIIHPVLARIEGDAGRHQRHLHFYRPQNPRQ